VALTLAVGAAGCGIRDPVNDPEPGERAAVPTSTVGADTRGGGQAAAPSAAASPTPGATAPAPADAEAVVRRFADTFINWEWETMVQSRRDAAAMAVGSLRDELLGHAAELQAEYERRPSEQANSGTVEGIVAEPGKPIYVITHERASYADSVPPQELYSVYIATVVRSGGTWKLSEWRAVTS
jgi:hypothetical protein